MLDETSVSNSRVFSPYRSLHGNFDGSEGSNGICVPFVSRPFSGSAGLQPSGSVVIELGGGPPQPLDPLAPEIPPLPLPRPQLTEPQPLMEKNVLKSLQAW